MSPTRAAREKARKASDHHHDVYTERTYGVKYSELLASQGGVCLICHKPFRSKRGSIDHCHHCGQVRGIIHAFENTAIGRMEYHSSVAQAGSDYLGRIAQHERTTHELA